MNLIVIIRLELKFQTLEKYEEYKSQLLHIIYELIILLKSFTHSIIKLSKTSLMNKNYFRKFIIDN